MDDFRGKRAAFEAAGYFWSLLLVYVGMCDERIRAVAYHIHANGPARLPLFRLIANSFVKECKRLKAFFTRRFVVMLEGNYKMKTLCAGSPRADCKAAFEQEKYTIICVFQIVWCE